MPNTLLNLFCRLTGIVCALILSGCSSIGVINALTPADGYALKSGLSYGKEDNQKLDVYVPRVAPVKAPLVVFFYGGRWRDGERADYKFIAEALTANGIVVVIPDYRKYPQVSYPAFLEDSAAATAWAIRHAEELGADARRVYVMGHSAGAYNAAMIAYDKRWLSAQGETPASLAGFIGVAGPYNFLPIVDKDVMPIFDWPNTSPDTQAINHVEANAPPALLLAADHDSVVNPDKNTDRFAEQLRAKGNRVRVVRYANVGHVTVAGAIARPLRWLAPVLKDVLSAIKPAN